LYGNFNNLKKRFKILVEKSLDYEVIPIEVFFDIKSLLKIVKVGHKTMLKNLDSLNVYL
jgi:hypothetical protein